MKKILLAVLVLLMTTVMTLAAAEETAQDPGDALSDQVEGLHVNIQHEADSPEWVANLPAAQDADQLFVVAAMGMDKTTAYITMHQRDADGHWKQILSTPGFVGRNGLCMDEDRREGCGQTPAGIYHFNKAFGIAPDPGCAIPYIQVILSKLVKILGLNFINDLLQKNQWCNLLKQKSATPPLRWR